MAVLQMERIHICAMKRDRKKILELVQRRGVVEITDAPMEDEVFGRMDTSPTRALLDKNAQTAAEALELLKKYTPAKDPSLGFLRGREAVPLDVSDAFYKAKENVLRTASRILQIEREMAEAKAQVARSEAQAEALVPWLDLPFPQNFSGTKKTAVFIGSLEGDVPLDEVLTRIAAAAPELDPVHVELVSHSAALTTLYAMVLKKDAPRAEEALRAIGLTRPSSPSGRIPTAQKARQEEKRQKALDTIEELKTEMESYADRFDDIRFLHDHMKMRSEKYGVIEQLAQSKHVFVLDGYIPARDAPALEAALTAGFTCEVDRQLLAETEDAPVQLKNNPVVEPMEPVLESYSLPARGEIDPCGAMAIFYYIMFGLMFSDFGYGLIMAAICGIVLLKFKNMEGNWRKNVKLFFGCGLATMFWGVVFSSYFGDIFDAVARQFFGRAADAPPIVPPLWFLPLKQPMTLLMFCLLIGIIHLSAGYLMNALNSIKRGDYPAVLYDAVFPAVLIYPLIIVLMGTDLFGGMAGFRLSLPPVVTPICLAVSGICLVGILFTGGRESKSWPKRLMKGAYACYNALSGWLSDTLSYSRLLALGLATGVIGSVMNQLGGMFGSGIVGVVGLVVVFCLGHSLNFGINALGSYVHSNRLEYVEFFGKFYEGGGRKFQPFGIHTKYYKIEEETQHGTN